MRTITSVPPLLQKIAHWPHTDGGEAHCLAQIYQRPDATVVVLCEDSQQRSGNGADARSRRRSKRFNSNL